MTTVEITHNRFTWTNIIAPDADDVERLRLAQPYIHPLNLEDLTSSLERPKIDEQDEYLFVVMHFPVWDAAHRLSRASEIEFIVGRNFLVTAHDGSLKALNLLVERCQQDADERPRERARPASRHTAKRSAGRSARRSSARCRWLGFEYLRPERSEALRLA